jgi:hypothetical protein
MSVEKFSFQKAIPIIVIAWILSLITAVAVVFVVTPSVIPIIGTDKIADDAIITTKLADGTVTSAKIVDGTITGEDINDGSIVAVKISNGAVTTAKIADGAVTSEQLADGAVVNVNLADGSVTAGKIANGAVTSSKIADDAVVTVKMADGSVTTAKILDGTITAADLATGAVTSVKIADGAVTTAKIADGAITNMKLAALAIPFNSTYTTVQLDKSTATWENITGMSVQLTLQRKSTLLIMFSTQALTDAPTGSVIWRARVNATDANPGSFFAQPPSTTTSFWASFSYNFISKVNAGQFTIYMQWNVYGGGLAYIGARTLFVIALPE